jgi:hypothetical protein
MSGLTPYDHIRAICRNDHTVHEFFKRVGLNYEPYGEELLEKLVLVLAEEKRILSEKLTFAIAHLPPNTMTKFDPKEKTPQEIYKGKL